MEERKEMRTSEKDDEINYHGNENGFLRWDNN